MSEAVYLRRHASCLFEMAMGAFERGDLALGDELTGRAIGFLEDAKAADAAAQALPAPAEPSPPKKDDSKE